MKVCVTHHAVRRYQERVNDCSRDDALDQIREAWKLARPATAAQIRWFTSHAGGRKERHSGAGVMMYCPVESLFIAGRRLGQRSVLVITLLRCPETPGLAIRRHRGPRHEASEE